MTLSDSGATEVAPADDLRADLEAAFAPTEPGIGHNGGPEIDAEQPARDATGKFAGKAQDAPQEGAEADETQEGAQQPADASKAPERLAAPDGWPSDAKTQWDRMPRAAQEALKADLEAGRLTLGVAAKGEPAPDPVRDVVKTYEGQFISRGLTPDGAVRALFEAQRMLDENPIEGLRSLARSYGVNLETLAPPQQAQPGYHDPVVTQLQQELTQIKGVLTQQQRAAHEASVAETQRSIQSFAEAKGEDGQPLRPFFAEVRATMGRLMENGTANDLADAYDKAIWATPAIRLRVLEAERKAEADREATRRAQAAKEARTKASSVTTNPSVTAKPAAPDDLRTAIEAAWGA